MIAAAVQFAARMALVAAFVLGLHWLAALINAAVGA